MAFSKPYARKTRIDLDQLGVAGEIAVLVGENFAASDLTLVASSAERAGYKTTVFSPKKSLVSGRSAANEEMNFVVDGAPGDREASSFAGVIIPGGAQSVQALSDDQDARLMVLDAIRANKPVLAMGEAVAFLGEAAEKTGVEGDAALALNGEVFAATGETAREDASGMFIQAMGLVDQAA